MAEESDWIAGTGGAALDRSAGHGKMIYAMRVDEKIPLEEYCLSNRGIRTDAEHEDIDDDRFALISYHFFYFGRNAIDISEIPTRHLQHAFEKRGPRYRYDFSEEFIEEFATWLRPTFEVGVHGPPCKSHPELALLGCENKGEAKGKCSMKRRIVLLRIGIDAGCGGIQSPLFKDGTFELVCIPDNKSVSVHIYGNFHGKNGRPLTDYFPESRRRHMAAQHIHVDPEFETFTYGDPTTPKRSLRHLNPGDFLVFYCGLQEWDAVVGRNADHRPALYLVGYFEVAFAGMASDMDKKVMNNEFGNNFHVRYSTVFEQQKKDLVLVKGGVGSRLFKKAYQISSESKDRAGKPLKVLSPETREIFGSFGGRESIQRSLPRWVDEGFVDKATHFVKQFR